MTKAFVGRASDLQTSLEWEVNGTNVRPKNVAHRSEEFMISQDLPPTSEMTVEKALPVASNVLPDMATDDANPDGLAAPSRTATGFIVVPRAAHASSVAALTRAHVVIATSNSMDVDLDETSARERRAARTTWRRRVLSPDAGPSGRR